MQTHSARGHRWMVALLGESLSLVRLTPTGGWTQRVMPVNTVRHVELSPPSLLRRGRLTLHLDGPSHGGHDVETVHFDRGQHEAVRDLTAALEAVAPRARTDGEVPGVPGPR